MDFKSYLEKTSKNIDEELDLILSDFLSQAKKTNIKLLPFALGLLNSCKGGKRIRGTLVGLGYELAQGSSNMDIIKVGAALEILHAGFLIHDDIIDESPTRRGKPSLYKQLSASAEKSLESSAFKSLGGDHYGVSQAITIGGIGLFLPIKIITNTNFLGEYKLKVLEKLSEMVINTGWGQIMDVEKSEDTLFIQTFKTAKYTTSGPLQIGAMLAGADDETIKKLGEFGENLGIAYQIQDDILDGEGKEVEELEAKALKYTSEGKKIIPEITDDKNMKKLLEQICDYLVERKV